ncbi:hypothetical protein ABES80_23110 [Bacillus gobiensis]|uniref:hypothetical protein n=1 Tax=Bacillus gobiensis TaxID=1441095 RepID=UPI003D1A0A35
MGGTLKGTAMLVYRDMKYQFVMFSLITLFVAFVFLMIGLFIETPIQAGVIFGPFYGLIAVYGGSAYVTSFRYAMGFGSTRTLFLKVFYTLGILFVIVVMLFLNILYFIMEGLYNLGVTRVSLFHIGNVTSFQKGFFPYLWVDIMIGIVLLGLVFFVTSLWYKYGFMRISIGSIILGVIAFLLLYNIGFQAAFQWMAHINHFTLFTGIGLVGLITLFSTYLFMRNAPLSYRSKKG